MTELAQTISNYGLSIVLSGAFLYQYFKAQRYNERREEKLYALVDQLSAYLPDIKEEIEEVHQAIEKGGVNRGY